MRGMFESCTQFNGDISGWDVSGVLDMNSMFHGTKVFNRALNNWNTRACTDMGNMFRNSAFNCPLDRWNVARVKDFSGMFSHGHFRQDIAAWDVSSATDMSGMFYFGAFDSDVSQWNVRRVDDFSGMFAEYSGLHMVRVDIADWAIDPNADLNEVFSDDTLNDAPRPSVYHWLRALEERSVVLKAEWHAHLQDHTFLVDVIGMAPHEAAHRIHALWKDPRLELVTPSVLPLPSLEE